MLASHAGEVVGRHRRRVGVWLPVVAYERRQDRQGVGADDELVVLGAEALGDAAGVHELGVIAFVEADGEGADLRGLRSHAGDERARVEAA